MRVCVCARMRACACKRDSCIKLCISAATSFQEKSFFEVPASFRSLHQQAEDPSQKKVITFHKTTQSKEQGETVFPQNIINRWVMAGTFLTSHKASC